MWRAAPTFGGWLKPEPWNINTSDAPQVLLVLALPHQAAAVQIERSASEVQHLAAGYINRLEIEPVGH